MTRKYPEEGETWGLLALATGWGREDAPGVAAEQVRVLEEGLSHVPDNPDLRIELARKLAACNRDDEAWGIYYAILQEDRPDPRANLGLARIAGGRGHPDMAMELIREVQQSELGPDELYDVATMLLTTPGCVAEARATLEAVVLASPSPRGMLLLSILLEDTDPARSEALRARAHATEGSSPAALAFLEREHDALLRLSRENA